MVALAKIRLGMQSRHIHKHMSLCVYISQPCLASHIDKLLFTGGGGVEKKSSRPLTTFAHSTGLLLEDMFAQGRSVVSHLNFNNMYHSVNR